MTHLEALVRDVLGPCVGDLWIYYRTNQFDAEFCVPQLCPTYSGLEWIGEEVGGQIEAVVTGGRVVHVRILGFNEQMAEPAGPLAEQELDDETYLVKFS